MNLLLTPALQAYVELGVAMRPTADKPNPFDGFIGSADTGWLTGIKTGLNGLTGKAIGAIAVIAIVMVIIGGVMIALAGKSKSKAEEGAAVITNVGKGIGVIFILVPILVGILGTVAVSFG